MLGYVGSLRKPFRRRSAPLIQTLGSLLAALALLLLSQDAHAYAWMVRHGYAKCASCHVDPSGGELLTGFGRVQSDVTLSQQWTDNTAPGDFAKFLGGLDEPDALRIGASGRVMTLLFRDGKASTFPMQIDAYSRLRLGQFIVGGSIGVSKVADGGAKHSAAAQLTTNEEGYNAVSRSHYIGFEPDDEWTIRLGRLNLPFGLRVPEHTLWVREETRTDRESDQQHGIATAYSGGRWRGELMFSLGNYQVNPDRFRERGYAGFLELMATPTVGIGVSGMALRSEDDRLSPEGLESVRTAHGLMFRGAFWKPLVVMAEFDVITRSRADVGYTGVIQLDFEPYQGVHLQAVGELLDRGKTQGAGAEKGMGEPKFGGWAGVGYFPIPHLDVRLDVVARDDEHFTLQTQAHLYF